MDSGNKYLLFCTCHLIQLDDTSFVYCEKQLTIIPIYYQTPDLRDLSYMPMVVYLFQVKQS